MGEGRSIRRQACTALLALALEASAPLASTPAASPEPLPAPRPEQGAFPVRMVKLVGSPSDPAVRAHIAFCVEAGFNTVWIYSHQAGRWTREDAPAGPFLEPAFVDLSRWCRRRGVRVFVSLNPVSDS